MSETHVKSLPGTEDRLPENWTHWRSLRDAARRQFQLYGYGELAFPIIEDTRLFIKGTGETTDIVEKQMYTIGSEDNEEETITLRPEGTPSAVRAYLENDLHKKQTFQKFWYAGPMFRKERPQKGRLRQFHQVGVEAIGGGSPILDAETIALANDLFSDAGLSEFQTYVNTIGCRDCRPEYRDAVHSMLDKRKTELCEDCQNRLDRNVLRILDCKIEQCQEVAADLPSMNDFLCGECGDHHKAVLDVLERENIRYEVDPHLVRGLDYYTRTVFEIKHTSLGARDTICGGGRYDNLVEQFGGPSLPCIGFALGVEATLLALNAELGKETSELRNPDVYVVCFEDHARPAAFEQVQALRGLGVSAEMDYEDRSAKAQMRMANRMEAKFCYLIGERELSENEVLVKDMESGEQWNIPWAEAADKTAERM